MHGKFLGCFHAYNMHPISELHFQVKILHIIHTFLQYLNILSTIAKNPVHKLTSPQID